MVNLPFVSIIIPTYNRPKTLQKCLQGILLLDYPKSHLEVVVVDDGSQKGTYQKIITWSQQTSLSIKFLWQTNQGPASARNYGAQNAKGQFLFFTDDDCTPHPKWLSIIVNHMKSNPLDVVGGHTVNMLTDNIYSTASQLLIDYIYSYYNNEQPQFFTTNNIAIPKNIFQQISGFDVSFPSAAAEDRDLCDRLQECTSLRYLSTAIIYHEHKLSLRKFFRQHCNYGQGAYYYHKLRAKRNQTLMRLEPLSFYRQLITYPISVAKSQNRWKLLLSVLMFISQVANAIGFYSEKWKNLVRNIKKWRY